MVTKKALEIGQKAFELYIENEANALKEYASSLNISVTALKLHYLNPYKNRITKPKPTADQLKKYQQIELSQLADSDVEISVNFIKELLKFVYTKEALNFIAASGYNMAEISHKISVYLKWCSSEEDQEQLKIIYSLLKKNQVEVFSITKNNAIENELRVYEQTKEILESFINDETKTFDEFNREHQKEISKSQLNWNLRKMRLASEEDQKLAHLFAQRLANENKRFKEVVNKILQRIKKDSIDSFSRVPFSILDYYRITNLNPEQFSKKIKKLKTNNHITRENYLIFKTFLSLYEYGNTLLTEEDLLDYNYLYNGVKLNKTSKKEVIKYLKSIPAPLSMNTYKKACEDYINGKIITDLPKTA